MTDPPRRQRWNIPLSPWRGDTPVHLGPLIDFPWRTLSVRKDRGAGPGMVNALYVISVNKSCASTNALDKVSHSQSSQQTKERTSWDFPRQGGPKMD